MTKNVFQKILDKELPADFLYEDESCIAINDIHPKAPVHILVIPRKPIESLKDLQPEDHDLIAHMIFVANKLAAAQNFGGYKVVFNVGEKGGQEIFHLHLHLLGWL